MSRQAKKGGATMRFTKMQGAGNDYIYINCFQERVDNPAALAVAVSDRHFGVGSDGLVLICPSTQADFKMRMFNADGSEGQMCGNAVRCIAKYVWDNGMTAKNPITLETRAGVKTIAMQLSHDKVIAATANMGPPALRPKDIPALLEGGEPVIAHHMGLADDCDLDVTLVSMGTPHCVAFVENVDKFPLEEIGPLVERHAWFPDRVNAEFVAVESPVSIRMRVWERGSGETLACGTGACASVVACVLNGHCRKDSDVCVKLRGGQLTIRWDSAQNTVFMTGPAAFVCAGDYPWPSNTAVQ
jgi:diaminopimelate epimerase